MMRLLLKLTSKIPLGILYRLAPLIYLVTFYLARYRRTIVFAHLSRAFPDKTSHQITKMAKAYYRNLADVMVEIIKAADMSAQELQTRVKYKNIEVLEPFITSGQSFMLLSAHCCNWEWLLLSLSYNLPIPMAGVYKPLHNAGVNRFIFETRSRFGLDLIDLKEFASEVLKNKSNQCAYSLLADQKPRGTGKYHNTQFLNRETRFFIGPEKIAQFVKVPIIYVRMIRVSKGQYEVDYSLLASPPYKRVRGEYPVTEQYARAVEAQILNQPESWLWSNRRWRSRSRSANLKGKSEA